MINKEKLKNKKIEKNKENRKNERKKENIDKYKIRKMRKQTAVKKT